MATVVNGTFTAQATGATVTPMAAGTVAYSISGTWTGTIVAERSFDAGTTWVIIGTHTVSVEADFESPGNDVIYRMRMSVTGTGTAVHSMAAPGLVKTRQG